MGHHRQEWCSDPLIFLDFLLVLNTPGGQEPRGPSFACSRRVFDAWWLACVGNEPIVDFPLGEDHLHQLIEGVEEDVGGEGGHLIKETPAGHQGADGSIGRIPELLGGVQEEA